jgi:signal transduction histidine kinase
MRLSTRFAAAIIAHVGLTVAVFSALNYRVFEVAGMPGAAERFASLTKGLADDLQASTAGLRVDIAGLRAALAVDGIARAGLNGGVDPTDGTTLAAWRAQLASTCVATLKAQPHYRRCRMIAVGQGLAHDITHDIVTVEHASEGTHDVTGALPQQQDDDLIPQTMRLADGDVFVSSVAAEREDDEAALAVLNVATLVRAQSKEPFGILVLTMDLRPVLTRLREATMPTRPLLLAPLPSRTTFVVNEHGDYLVNPDPARELGFAFGKRFRLQDDFPGLGEESLKVDAFGPLILNDRAGARFAVGLAGIRLAGGPRVTVLQAIPYTALMAAKRAVYVSTAIGASVAALGAIALAVFLARSMSRPLVQMTRAVTAFGRGEPMTASGAPAMLTVPVGAGGEIGVLATAFAGMAAQVSEKTATMRRNAEILDVIMARMADAVLLVDEAGAIVFANAAAKGLLGARADVGWNAWTQTYEVYGADGVTPLPAEEWPITRAVRGENVDNFELAFRLKGDERAVHIIISGRPIKAAGDAPQGAVMVFRDVTAWKETERLLHDAQKMEAIGQLTGGIAHDFNNVLTVITGTIDIMIAGVADRPVLARIAKMIDEAAERGGDLTRQLLAFARKQPLAPRETDINALVIDTAKLLRPSLGEAIQIESELAAETWTAMIDPTQLSTALLNLALNARDAMAKGGTLTLKTMNVILDQVYVRANPEVTPGPYVMIAVRDTGTGIPAALHDKVFEPFFTTKDIGKGTGLGLSMVYGFVKQSGGHIKIDSAEGRGTTFKLYLPRSAGEEVLEPAPFMSLQGGNETILVVEDDPLVRKTVIAAIEGLGYTTIAATNAAEALALVDEGRAFDLLFTDVVMPGGMNGRELAAEVARRRPGTPVLYTSGYTDNTITHDGRLDPDVALLNKPYRKAELAQKIREVLAVKAVSATVP